MAAATLRLRGVGVRAGSATALSLEESISANAELLMRVFLLRVLLVLSV
jgi:hypothetical protein